VVPLQFTAFEGTVKCNPTTALTAVLHYPGALFASRFSDQAVNVLFRTYPEAFAVPARIP
jgi:hypothetical protein